MPESTSRSYPRRSVVVTTRWRLLSGGTRSSASGSVSPPPMSVRAPKSQRAMSSPLRGVYGDRTLNMSWRTTLASRNHRNGPRRAFNSPPISPRSSHRSRSTASSPLRARAVARQTPLIPPAEVPLTTSITTRTRGPPRAILVSASKYARSVRSSAPANGFVAGARSNARDATTSFRSSFVMPCMYTASDTPP